MFSLSSVDSNALSTGNQELEIFADTRPDEEYNITDELPSRKAY